MEQTVNGAKSATRFCTGCGSSAPVGASFCSSCGSAVASPMPATEPHAPVVLPHGESRRSRVDRRLLLVGAGCVVALALLATLLVLRGSSDGETFDHERAIADAGRTVADMAEDLSDAGTIAALRSAAQDAAQAAERLDAPLAEVDDVGDADERRATRQALDASQALLVGYGTLSELAPERLDQWPALRGELTELGASLSDADRALVDVDLPGLGATVVDSTASTTEDIARLVEGAEVALRDWKAEADRITSDRAMQLMALSGYEQAFRGHDARYIELRKDLQDFVNRVDANGASYGEAYSTLSQATTQREEIRNAMRAMAPPAALATTHAGVVGVLDEAIGAMRSASEGVRQYEYSWEYWYYKDTPGWQTFMSASSGITGAHDTAFRAWEAAVAAERARVEAIAPPAAPAV